MDILNTFVTKLIDEIYNNSSNVQNLVIRIALWIAVTYCLLYFAYIKLGEKRSALSQCIIFIVSSIFVLSIDLDFLRVLGKYAYSILFLSSILTILFAPMRIAVYLFPTVGWQAKFTALFYLLIFILIILQFFIKGEG